MKRWSAGTPKKAGFLRTLSRVSPRSSIPQPPSNSEGGPPMKLYAQLNFGGNCEAAFRFYEKHLGGKITMMMNQSQAPGAPSGAGKAIIHARMNIGDTVLMGNDVPPSVFQNIRSVYMHLSLDCGRSRASPQPSCRRRGGLYAVAGDVLCDALQPASRPLWRDLVNHPRTSETVSRKSCPKFVSAALRYLSTGLAADPSRTFRILSVSVARCSWSGSSRRASGTACSAMRMAEKRASTMKSPSKDWRVSARGSWDEICSVPCEDRGPTKAGKAGGAMGHRTKRRYL